MAELTWQGQSEWDSAQDRYGVASRSLGGFSGHTLRLGWDHQYGPLSDSSNYWPLTDPSDNTDVTGGHDVTINGTSETAGVFGMPACEFDPDNEDWVGVGNPTSYEHGDDLSLMAHIHVPEAYGSAKFIAGYAQGHSDTADGYWILYIRPVDIDQDTDEWEIGWFYRQDGEWHGGIVQRRELRVHGDNFLAATFDFDSQLATVTVNGHSESNQIGSYRDEPSTWNVDAAIGDRAPGAGRFFDGNISNVAYWSRSLDQDEREALTTIDSGGSLTTATKSDDLAATEITTDASVGSNRYIDVSVYQDTTGNGAPDNSQTVSLDNGVNTYDLSGFDASTGADYWLEIHLDTTTRDDTPELESVSITTGDADTGPPLPVDDRIEWNKQSDWDRAQDRARVVSRDYGARDGNELELGHDPEYGPIKDAVFYAPLDETTMRQGTEDVISGTPGEFGGSPTLSVPGGTGTTGMHSGGSVDPGYVTWKNMSAFRHKGSRTIAALINPEELEYEDKAVIMGAGSGKHDPEWTLEIRKGRKLVFRYKTGRKKRHGHWKWKWKSKSKETVIRSFHEDFMSGYHVLVFVFDEERDGTDIRGGKNWTIVETENISVSIDSSDIDIITGMQNRHPGWNERHGAVRRNRQNVHSRARSNINRHGRRHRKKRHSFPRHKWWRGKRRKSRAIGLCFFGKFLDVKKCVRPFPRPDDPPDVRIGRHPTWSCRDYQGVIDDVIYWDRALSETEIEEIRRTYADGYLVTRAKQSDDEAVEIHTRVDRPEGTSIELTVYQDTSGDGDGNREQTINVPDGETSISLNSFEAAEGADYWLEWKLNTQDKTETPTIRGAEIDLSSRSGSVIDADNNGVIRADEIGSLETV